MRLTNIQKREKINEFLDRPGSEVKTIRQVVRGLEDEGVHISDTLVKAVRAERAESPPVEPTPLFRAEVVEVVPEPVVTSTAIQTFVPTEVIKDDRVWIDARPIHAFVRSKQQFVDWIKNRIEEIGAVENRDYLVHKFMKQVFHQGGMRNAEQNDYYVTPSMGQELGMLEKTAEGRSVRLGFIERSERLAKIESAPKPVPVTFDLNNLDPDAMLEALISVQQLRKQEKAKQIELSGNVKQLEEKNTKLVSEVADLHDHLDALGSEVEELKPKAQVLDQLTKENKVGMLPREVAGIIGVGQKEIAYQLTTPTHKGGLGLCYRIGKNARLHPYSQYGETGLGYFYVALGKPATNGQQYPQTYITTKGLEFIRQRFNEGGPSTLSIAR